MIRLFAAVAVLALGCAQAEPRSTRMVGHLFASIPDGPIANIELVTQEDGTVRMLYRFD